jgi:hypothetical protein
MGVTPFRSVVVNQARFDKQPATFRRRQPIAIVRASGIDKPRDYAISVCRVYHGRPKINSDECLIPGCAGYRLAHPRKVFLDAFSYLPQHLHRQLGGRRAACTTP